MKKSRKQLDLFPSSKLVNLFLNEEEKTIKAIKKQRVNITKAVNQIIKQVKSGGRVIYIGSGTSGRLGILDAVECNPTFSTTSFQAIIAGGRNAFIKAKEGAEDNQKQAIKDLSKLKPTKKDIIVGISASGETPYTVSAISYAKKKKLTTIGIASNKKSTLSRISRFSICPQITCEVIQGSSRLRSGTAQKVVLNILSSASMIKTGKVYDDLMIDVKPTNKKLIKRAIGIISTVCNIPFNKAKGLFFKSKKDTKAAIVMHFKQYPLDKAKRMLKLSNYNLRKLVN